MKTLKAWAVVDKKDRLIFLKGEHDPAEIWKTKQSAEWATTELTDEKVVRVEIREVKP